MPACGEKWKRRNFFKAQTCFVLRAVSLPPFSPHFVLRGTSAGNGDNKEPICARVSALLGYFMGTHKSLKYGIGVRHPLSIECLQG